MNEVGLLELGEGKIFHAGYRVVRCIKAGGMGAVYEVVHIETRRRRALKVMLPSLVSDPDARARFTLEATITADVESEHLVEIFDAGIDAETGAPFLVMELLKGEDLGDVLKRRGRIPPNEALLLLRQVAFALDRTHAAGIVHRDLKPENLFVTRRDDGSARLRVLDFGIAKLRARSHESARTTCNFGTPRYMSPEQVRGDGTIDHRADLCSLGHIAYALIVGETYWEREASDSPWSLLMKITQGATEPASSRAQRHGVALPAGFDAWFAKATALAPHDRFDSASALVEALTQVLGEEPLQQTIPMAPRPASALRSAGAVVAGSVLAAGGVLGIVRAQSTTDRADAGIHDERTAAPPLPRFPSSTQAPVVDAPTSAPMPATAAPPGLTAPPHALPAPTQTPIVRAPISAPVPATAARPAHPVVSAASKPTGPTLPDGVDAER
jgi:serine/threonine-protein kinase